MALKTRGKLVALGIATFAAAAGLAFGTVASASGGTDQPVVRITQDQQAGLQQTQQSQQTPRAHGGDARDCPFGHGSSNQSGTPNSGTPNSGTPNSGTPNSGTPSPENL
jgi:hypothetical protein